MTKQELIKTIEEISAKLDAQRSALEDLESDMREANLWNDEIDIDGEINQSAAEVESVVDNLAKVIEAIKAPETEIQDLGPDDREQILRDKILEGLESIQ